MTFTIDLAKTYFQYSTSKATEFEAILTKALVPAKNQFLSKIQSEEYKRFVNFSNPITATSKESDNLTFNYDSAISEFKVDDSVTIDSIMFTIVSVDDDEFVIDKEYTGSSLEITNNTMDSYSSIFAWFVLYMFTIIGRELFIGIIVQENQEFGDGNQFGAEEKLKKYQKDLKDSIKDEYSVIQGNQTPIQLGRM